MPAITVADTSTRSEPYCGLYAVFAAGEYHDLQPEFLPLLNRKYLSCTRGSSIQELQQAAGDMGMQTLFVTNMTAGMLRRPQHPVILHVRADLASTEYDHYVLFVEHTKQGYVCIDGEQTRVLREPALLALWAGAGLVVAKQEISQLALLGPAWAQTLAVLILGTICVGAIKWTANRVQLPAGRRWPGQVAIILIVSVLLGVSFHLASSGGLLKSGNMTSRLAMNGGTR
jgi:hypothetical protein